MTEGLVLNAVFDRTRLSDLIIGLRRLERSERHTAGNDDPAAYLPNLGVR